jgi:hypothetical protein
VGRPFFAEWVVMLDQASQFDEASEAIAVNASNSQSVLVHWSKGSEDGEVIIECSDSKTFRGTWAELKRIPCSGENRLDLYEHKGPCVFIRTRITKPILGGTVTTKLQCLVG